MKTENEILKKKLEIAIDSLELLKNEHNSQFVESVLIQIDHSDKMTLDTFRKLGAL